MGGHWSRTRAHTGTVRSTAVSALETVEVAREVNPQLLVAGILRSSGVRAFKANA
jgi:hypothetical protein